MLDVRHKWARYAVKERMTEEDIQRLARFLQLPAPEGRPVEDAKAAAIIRAYVTQWCDAHLRSSEYPTVNHSKLLERLYSLRRTTREESFPSNASTAIRALEAELHTNTAIKNGDLSFAARLACVIAPENGGKMLLDALVTGEYPPCL